MERKSKFIKGKPAHEEIKNPYLIAKEKRYDKAKEALEDEEDKMPRKKKST